ncbi:MAG TPA: MGMT family protein [Acidimicrobiales bacterium]|nr:MGMT family protein [Acidimicrobiales bacterium]
MRGGAWWASWTERRRSAWSRLPTSGRARSCCVPSATSCRRDVLHGAVPPEGYVRAIATGSSRTEAILARVAAIPEGFVRTYGDVDPRAPRLVGHVLATTSRAVPWHRVVRADGSLPMGERQRRLLTKEGVPMRGSKVVLTVARVAG